VLECVINISEGRDLALLERLSSAAGASLRDRHSDIFHNRSVFTLINSADELLQDVRALITDALGTLDLEHHDGVHPRLGVVDVVPFVALPPEEVGVAIRLRDDTAQWIATTFALPVFLYGAHAPGERTLPYVRAHAFADLAPDFGPARPDPRNGSVVVGARDVLVAWNLWLRHVSVSQARDLARVVRGPGVRALGLAVGDFVQVSCNLIDLAVATPSTVYDLVNANLSAPGLIDHAEVVGLFPRSLLDREEKRRWEQLGLHPHATIESRLAAAGVLEG
jgi:glutamate formiminotransferase